MRAVEHVVDHELDAAAPVGRRQRVGGAPAHGDRLNARALGVAARDLEVPTSWYERRRHGMEVDDTVWKSTFWYGSRRLGLEVDATVRKSTPRYGSRRHGLEVDATGFVVDVTGWLSTSSFRWLIMPF